VAHVGDDLRPVVSAGELALSSASRSFSTATQRTRIICTTARATLKRFGSATGFYGFT